MTSPEQPSTSRPPQKQGQKRTTPASPKSPPAEAVTAAPPLFAQQEPPPPREIPPLQGLDAEDFASGSPLLDEMPERPSTTETGSSPEFSAADRKQLATTLKKAIEAIGRFLNARFTTDDLERDVGLYEFQDDESEGIAEPAAGIIGRRGGLAQAANPDINDAIRGALALAIYVSRQLSLRRDIRRARGELPAPVTPEQAA